MKDISNSDERLTIEGTVAGTPAFMSPEQAAGTSQADARTDIYSLGAVAYFLLTARAPFSNRTTAQVMAAHIYEQPAPVCAHRPDVDPRLDAIVVRCLSKKPADRFQTVESVKDALDECKAAGSWKQSDAAEWWHRAENATTAV